jgi:hypothetical protein
MGSENAAGGSDLDFADALWQAADKRHGGRG